MAEPARDALLAAYAKLPNVQSATAAIKLVRASTPDDPEYAQQWALPKIGWDQTYGVTAIPGTARIAVLDTGVDAAHPDLASRMAGGFTPLVGGDPNRDPNGTLRIAGVLSFIWESSQGDSIMHVVTFRIRKRLTNGVAAGASYTL